MSNTLNVWFWGGKTRQQFEQELQKNAVLLTAGFGPPKRKRKAAAPIVVADVPRVDIEAVRARKNALVKSGVLKVPVSNVTH